MKQLTCIVCPIGCRITAEFKDGQYEFSGNRCKRGADFARTELTSPKRSLTTTVRTTFRDMPALPVRTNGELSRELIPEAMHLLGKVLICERIGIGEIVVKDILGSGCDIIATGDMLISAEGEEMPC